MQRWFFLEDPENAIRRAGKTDTKEDGVEASTSTPTEWFFRVLVHDLLPGETVCVTGSCDSLGNWLPAQCRPLTREKHGDIWSGKLKLDCSNIEYRYCVCVIVEADAQVIVRRWETFLNPRSINSCSKEPKSNEPELFGVYGDYSREEKGWLTKETVVQFKLFNNPLTIWRPRYASRTIYLKVTPVNLTRHNNDKPLTMAEALEESLSTDTQDMIEPPKHAYTVVANLNSPDCIFHPQEQFGKGYNPGDVLIFETSVLDLKNVAFLIDLYIYGSHALRDDPPYHAGFSYLLPSSLQASEGHVILPVTSVKHRPLGQIELDYFVIKPMKIHHHACDMKVSFARHWKNNWMGLDVGHRGLGTSFKTTNCSDVRENTIASLKTAASHGADFVEFDVQLSKDLVPIIYHDFTVCIAMKKKKELEETDMFELPVKELTLEQLHFLKVYHLTEGRSKNPKFFDEDSEEHQPFPTLQLALEVLDVHVGFNIEIKWGTQFLDGSQEVKHPIDVNLYVDTILDVVLKHSGQRRIVFSCFNADICSMIRLKQNKYPVMFLTQGQTVRYPLYNDPRCMTIKDAVQFALSSSILGVNVHTEDLLRDSSQVRLATEAGLVIFCWGDDNNDPNTIKFLKELGLHAVIYDKIDQYSSKEVKESIFLVEARESQRQLLVLAAANAEIPPTPPITQDFERILDVEKVRQNLTNVSTATSLESLESKKSEKLCFLPPQT